MVWGRIAVTRHLQYDPPDFHVEAVVDGARFCMERDEVMEGYHARTHDVPREWIERVEIEVVAGYGSAVPITQRPAPPKGVV